MGYGPKLPLARGFLSRRTGGPNELARLQAGGINTRYASDMNEEPMSTVTEAFSLTGILRNTLHDTIYGSSAYSCLDVLNRALRLLFINNGIKGLCANGELLTAGRLTVSWNGGVMSGFNEAQMTKMLKAEFPNVSVQAKITIENPDPPFDAGSWGSARVPSRSFVLNHWDIIKTGNAQGWPNDNSGADRMMWVFAAVIMHELMHCHGFSHPETVDWSAGSAYATTLPYLAGRSVLMASPYWAEFQGGFGLAFSQGFQDCRIRH